MQPDKPAQIIPEGREEMVSFFFLGLGLRLKRTCALTTQGLVTGSR